jgi:hypothetical protein
MSLASANERERRGAARLAGDRGARASIGQESAQARDRRLQGRAGQESRPDFHVPAYQDRAQDHGLDRQGEDKSPSTMVSAKRIRITAFMLR